jgi:hypothetical protein
MPFYRAAWRSFGTSGLVTGTTVTRWPRPAKSSGFVVYSGSSARRGQARALVVGPSVGHDVADRVPDQGAKLGVWDVVERVAGHEQPAEHRAQ